MAAECSGGRQRHPGFLQAQPVGDYCRVNTFRGQLECCPQGSLGKSVSYGVQEERLGDITQRLHKVDEYQEEADDHV